MKTLTLTQVTKTLKYSLSALVAVVAMTGCGSSSNNSNSTWSYGSCTSNCVTSSSVNVTGTAQNSQSGVYLTLQIVSVSSSYNYSNNSYSNSFYGSIQAQATLTINTNIYSQCGLPAGTYTLSMQNSSYGTWQGTSTFSGLQMTTNNVPIYVEGYIKSSYSNNGYYGMSVNLYPYNSSSCAMVLY